MESGVASNPTAVSSLIDGLGCSEILAHVLVNRGIATLEAAQRTLDPDLSALHDPDGLPEMAHAVQRMVNAIEAGETIAIVGHHDVDGSAGAAILLRVLERLGATVGYEMPGKWEGHGLNERIIGHLERRGVDVLIAVDCGTTDHAELHSAAGRDIDVLIVDHHPPTSGLPDYPCINPQRSSHEYPNRALSASGVSLKLAEVLWRERTDRPRTELFARVLPLAAIATVSDQVNLTRENRAIVRAGFDRVPACPIPGIARVVDRYPVRRISDLRWVLIPLLNAGQHDEAGDLLLRLFLETDRSEIDRMIDRLEAHRAARRDQRRRALAHVEECIADQEASTPEACIIVETDKFVGSVPRMRVAERFGKPTITYRQTRDGYAGWGNAPGNLDLLDTFRSCEDVLDEFRGRARSAGFRLHPEHLGAFLDRLRKEIRTRYPDQEEDPHPEIDAHVQPEELTRGRYTELERLAPFGPGNPQPCVRIDGVRLIERRQLGRCKDHVAFEPAASLPCSFLCWNARTVYSGPIPRTYDLVGTIGWDRIADRPSVEITEMMDAE